MSVRRVEILSYILSSVLALAMLMSYHMPVFSSFMLAFRITGAVAVFCLVSRCVHKGQSSLCSLLSKSSYFIYLAHFVFFMSFVDTAFFVIFGTSTFSLSIHYLLCPLVKVTIFVVIYFVLSKIRSFMLSERAVKNGWVNNNYPSWKLLIKWLYDGFQLPKSPFGPSYKTEYH